MGGNNFGGPSRSQVSQGSEIAGLNHNQSSASQVLHEAIIDLYLQVKVRSNDEVSINFNTILLIVNSNNHYSNKKENSKVI